MSTIKQLLNNEQRVMCFNCGYMDVASIMTQVSDFQFICDKCSDEYYENYLREKENENKS